MPRSQLGIVILAVAILAVGYVLYAGNASQYAQCHSVIGGIVKALDVNSASQCSAIDRRHYGSIAIMCLGGIVFLLGLVWGRSGRR